MLRSTFQGKLTAFVFNEGMVLRAPPPLSVGYLDVQPGGRGRVLPLPQPPHLPGKLWGEEGGKSRQDSKVVGLHGAIMWKPFWENLLEHFQASISPLVS